MTSFVDLVLLHFAVTAFAVYFSKVDYFLFACCFWMAHGYIFHELVVAVNGTVEMRKKKSGLSPTYHDPRESSYSRASSMASSKHPSSVGESYAPSSTSC